MLYKAKRNIPWHGVPDYFKPGDTVPDHFVLRYINDDPDNWVNVEGLTVTEGGGGTSYDDSALLTRVTAVETDLNAHSHPDAGQELGYAERTTQDTTTSLPADNTALMGNLIAGLSVTVTGTGRPVEVEFWCGTLVHSVVGGVIYAHLMQDGSQIAFGNMTSSKVNSSIGGLVVKRRLVIPEGAQRTFQVAKSIDTAGTGTYYADATDPMYLSVVGR